MATLQMMVKQASLSGVALPEIMFWRQAASVPAILGWLALTGGLHRLKTQRLANHAGRASAGMFGMVCNFGSLTLLPLAEATTFGFTAPLFAVILTGLALREYVGPWRWSAVVIGFAGVVVIAQPGHQPISMLGAAAGLGSGLMVAVISFQIRDLARTEEGISVVFYFALFGAMLMALFMPFYMTSHTAAQWLLLIGLGLVGTVGQILMTASLRFAAVSTVIVMDYTALIWATLYGWLLWNHLPPAATWIGAPLIMAAGLIVTWREHRLSRKLSPLGASEIE